MFKEERFVSGSGRRTGCQLNCLYHDEQSEEFVFTGYSDGSLRITPLSVGPKKIIDLGRIFLEAFPGLKWSKYSTYIQCVLDDDDENYQLQAIHVSPTINPKELILIGAITPTVWRFQYLGIFLIEQVESSKDKPKGRLVFCRVDSINQLMALNTPKFFSLDIDWTPLRIERVQLDIKRKFQFLVSSLEGPVHFFNSVRWYSSSIAPINFVKGDFMGQDCKSDDYSLSNTL